MFTQNKLFNVMKTKGGSLRLFLRNKKFSAELQANPYTKRHLNRIKLVYNMDTNSLRINLCTMLFIKDNVQEILYHPINIFLFRKLFEFKEMHLK